MTGTVSSVPLGIARVVVGTAAVLQGFSTLKVMGRLGRPEVLRLPRIDGLWVPVGPGLWLFGLFWLFTAAAFAAGWHTRIAGAGITFATGYVLALDSQLYSNHVYLLFLLCFLLTLADSGATLSADGRRTGRRASVPAWPAQLIKFQMCLVYAFAVFAKLNPDFLSGLVITGGNPWMEWLGVPFLPAVVAWAAVATEAILAVGLWNRRLRVPAVLLGLGLHGAITVTFWSIGILVFSLETVATYPIFFARVIDAPAGSAPGGLGRLERSR